MLRTREQQPHVTNEEFIRNLYDLVAKRGLSEDQKTYAEDKIARRHAG